MSRQHRRAINTRRWQHVRRAVFNRDGWRCVKCRAPGRLECDHVVPFRLDPHQDPFDIDGCQTLCVGCHIAKTRAENTRAPTPAEQRWRDLVADMQCDNIA